MADRTAYYKDYRQKNKQIIDVKNATYYSTHKNQQKNYTLKRKFGITLDQYNEMLASQNGCCKICGKKPGENEESLAVDHKHETGLKTGLVRGLLCKKCNMGLGYFNDDIEALRQAIKYLKEAQDAD